MTTVADRLSDLRAAVAALDREDVQAISLPLPGDARRAAVDAAVRSAAAAGRSAELDAARGALRHEAFVRYGRAMLRPTWLGLNWGLSSGPATDHAAVAAALDEAAVLAVSDDLLDEDTRDVLAWAPSLLLGSAAHTTDPGSLARAMSGTGRSRVWVAGIALLFTASLLVGAVTGHGISGLAVLTAGLLLVVLLARRDTARRRAP